MIKYSNITIRGRDKGMNYQFLQKWRISLTTVILLIAWSASVSAVTADKNLNNYSVNEGLSHNNVMCVLQDHSGLMWFATRAGMDSFDGSRFTHYELKNPSYPGQNFPRDMVLDQNGTIWVASQSGLFFYNEKTDTFEFYPLNDRFNIDNSSIFSVFSDVSGKLWLGTYNAFYECNLETNHIKKILNVRTFIREITRVNESELYFITTDEVYIYDSYTSTLVDKTAFFKQAVNVADSIKIEFSNIFSDNENRLWISTFSHGTFLFRNDLRYIGKIDSFESLHSRNTNVRKVISFQSDKYAVAVSGEGLFILDNSPDAIEKYTINEDIPGSLNNNDLRDLYFDRNDRLWIATWGGGISVYDPNLLKFELIVHERNNEQSLRNNIGKTILEDHLGNMWFGTQGGISIYFPEQDSWKHIYNRENHPDILFDNNISDIIQVSDNEIWVSCYGGGINIYRFNEDRFYRAWQLYPELKDVDLAYVSRMVIDNSRNVWFGRMRDATLINFNPEKNIINEFYVTNIGIMYPSPDSVIYTANNHSLWAININSNKLTRITFANQSDLRIHFVNSISGFKINQLLFGTEGSGLFIYNLETSEVFNISVEQGLETSNINSLVTEGDVIWFSSVVAISKISFTNDTLTNFCVKNGLTLTSFSPNIGIKSSDGFLYFGGNEGYIKIDPESFGPKQTHVRIKFTDLKINNISAEIGAEDSPLTENLNSIDQLTLNYKQNSFTIEFTGINYTNPSQNKYSWTLENFDKNWSELSTNRLATYTNIPSGRYVFKLILNTPDGTADIQEIPIKIMAPWWFSPQSIIVYFILFIGLIYLLIYLFKMNFKEKQAKEKISFFISVAHDLRTPLTLIQTPLTKVLKNNKLDQRDKKYLNMAVKNASKINNYFDQLLDFQKADIKKMKVHYVKSDLVSQIKDISFDFNPLITEMNINFKILAEEESIEFYYDKTLLEKIICNLLSNAIKYNQVNGKIRIKIQIRGATCVITVSDNGIGIPDKEKKEIFKRYFRATNAIQSYRTGVGVGLLLVKQLVDLMGGKIRFTSKEGKGSNFTLVLKILNSPPAQKSGEKNQRDYISVFQSDYNSEQKDENVPTPVEDPDLKKLPKLLIAEDNVELQEFLNDSLKDSFQVLIADNGESALEMARKYDVSLLISDIMMPKMDGRVLCNEIKNNIETCHIPVILLTALSDDYRIESYEAGADAYIEKPFDLNVLKSRIENLISSRKLLKEKFIKYDFSNDVIEDTDNLDQKFIHKANELVEENLNNPEFTIDEFSKEMMVSRSLLYRKIKAITDLSPIEFITYSRLRAATRLLSSSQLSVKEIAYKCGFTDPRYFSTIFKKHFHATPTEYVKESEDRRALSNIGD